MTEREELALVQQATWRPENVPDLSPAAQALNQICMSKRLRQKVAPCPTCGKPMTCFSEGETLVGFLRDSMHNHDDNCLERSYRCSEGHVTTVHLRRRCGTPGCDWVGAATCFCHSGVKVDHWPEEEPDGNRAVADPVEHA